MTPFLSRKLGEALVWSCLALIKEKPLSKHYSKTIKQKRINKFDTFMSTLLEKTQGGDVDKPK